MGVLANPLPIYVGTYKPSPAPKTSPKTKQKTLPAFSNLQSAERERPGTWVSTRKGPCSRRQGRGGVGGARILDTQN